MSHKVSDSIKAKRAAEIDGSFKQLSATIADQALTDAIQAVKEKDAIVRSDLATLMKPYLYTEEDGTLTGFVPDMTAKGYTELHFAPTDAQVDDPATIPPPAPPLVPPSPQPIPTASVPPPAVPTVSPPPPIPGVVPSPQGIIPTG